MQLVKTAYQSTTTANETLYIIKGVFKKRVYMVSGVDLYELVEHPVPKDVKNDQKS